jgi:hypothetical protein
VSPVPLSEPDGRVAQLATPRTGRSRRSSWLGKSSQGQLIRAEFVDGRMVGLTTLLHLRCDDGTSWKLAWSPSRRALKQVGDEVRSEIGPAPTDQGVAAVAHTRMRVRMGRTPRGLITSNVSVVATNRHALRCRSNAVRFALHRATADSPLQLGRTRVHHHDAAG